MIAEPSSAAAFRDELPELLPLHQDGQRVTKHTNLLGEFMERVGYTYKDVQGSSDRRRSHKKRA